MPGVQDAKVCEYTKDTKTAKQICHSNFRYFTKDQTYFIKKQKSLDKSNKYHDFE